MFASSSLLVCIVPVLRMAMRHQSVVVRLLGEELGRGMEEMVWFGNEVVKMLRGNVEKWKRGEGGKEGDPLFRLYAFFFIFFFNSFFFILFFFFFFIFFFFLSFFPCDLFKYKKKKKK